jgi:hypothetical protein
MTHIHPPAPAIIIIASALPSTPRLNTGWNRRVSRSWPPTKKPRLPRWSQPPIPSFDRRALYERVTRLLKQDQHRRDELKAASYSHLWCLQ